MRRIKYILVLSIFIVLVTGCHKQESILKLLQESYTIELGNTLVTDPLCYLDTQDLTNQQIESMKEKSSISFQEEEIESYDTRSQQTYEQVGTYKATIDYLNETITFPIVIEEKNVPIILGPNVLQVQIGQDYDFSKSYHIKSASQMEKLTFDTKDIDYQKVGNYSMLITAQSQGRNLTSQRTVTVQVSHNPQNQLPKSVELDIPYYNQLDAQAPNGCEATALYMALDYHEKVNQIQLKQFIDQQPRSLSPYDGFSGDPFQRGSHKSDYYTIFPQALIRYADSYTQMRDISVASLHDIKDELANKHPVLVWVTSGFQEPRMKDYYFGQVTGNLHIVLLNGYDDNKQIFYVKDPIDSQFTQVSYQQFQTAYESMSLAMTVEL